ncbi:hypothetical protein M2373_002479 [Chryseobacterium sp. JUb7]|nr:hypothetical protein [Chryseobacterium sp. JUb7]
MWLIQTRNKLKSNKPCYILDSVIVGGLNHAMHEMKIKLSFGNYLASKVWYWPIK